MKNKKWLLLVLLLFLLSSCSKKEEVKETTADYRTPGHTLLEMTEAWNNNDINKFSTYFQDPSTITHLLSKFYKIQDTSVYGVLRHVKIYLPEEVHFDSVNPPAEYEIMATIENTNCYVPFYNYLVEMDDSGQRKAETELISVLSTKDTDERIQYKNIRIQFTRKQDGDYVLKNGDFYIDQYDASFSGNINNLDLLNAFTGNIINSYVDYYGE